MSQRDFVAALLNPDAPEPAGLRSPAGTAAGKRFDVYRNNVTTSLIEALETGFPALRTLIGPQRFRALSVLFLRQSPPSDPRVMLYGDAMPAFLTGFGPLAEYPYLPDVARLEMALCHSYHAADAAPLPPQALVDLGEDLATAQLQLAPATLLLRSAWPVLDIWSSATQGTPPPKTGTAQTVLITRPDYDPVPTLVSAAQATAIQALAHGAAFADALGETDPQALLSLLISTAALKA